MANLSNINNKFLVTTGGNVLIGKTAANNATVGTQIMSAGDINPTVNGDTVARFNRLSNDGEIIRIQKDTSTVGYIGSNTAGGDPLLDIGSNSSGDSLMRFLTSGSERMRIDKNGLVTLASMSSNNSTSGNGGAIGMFADETRITSNWYYKSGQQKYVAGNGQAVIGLSTGTTDATSFIGFGVNGPADSAGPTLRMKITSAGVVKVENTAAAHLILNGDTNNTGDTGQADSIIDLLGDGNPGLYGYRINTENWSGQTALHFQEYLNGSYTSRLFISKDGNVGIGTSTPNYKLSVANASTRIISATYIDGANGIMSHAGAPNYGLESFQIRGDSISFWTDYDASHYQGLERMRITSEGDVLIRGTYNPYSQANRGNITLNGSNSNIIAFANNSSAKAYIYHNGLDFEINNGVAGLLKFATNSTERMRITGGGDTSIYGRVGIGNGSGAGYSSYQLYIRGNSNSSDVIMQIDNTKYGSTDSSGESKLKFGWNNHSAAAISAYKDGTVNRTGFKFYTEVGYNVPVEKMRITSGGEVDIVGTVKSGGNQRFGAGPAHGNSGDPGITTKANTNAGIYWNSDGSGGWGGGNFTTNNSDRNMKTNIVPMGINALNIIDSLETKYFNWTEKANRGDTSIRKAGIIAQDLKELMPEAVYGTEWSDEDENANGLALDLNATTALLIKAIQELKAEIELLKSK